MADRYWVGGTGTWNTTNTTNWSATSGGAGGASAPTSADRVFFDASSGGGTVTWNGDRSVLSLDATGFTGTFGGSTTTFTVAGDCIAPTTVTIPATNMTIAGGGTLAITLTSTGLPIITINPGAGATVDIQRGLNDAGNGRSLTILSGTTNFNSYTYTLGSIVSNTGTSSRVINFGTATLNLSGGTPLAISTIYTTFLPSGATFNFTSASGTFTGYGRSFKAVNFTYALSTSWTITGANTYENLSFPARGSAAGFTYWIFGADQTVTNTLTMPTGATPIGRNYFQTTAFGSPVTITAASVTAGSQIDFRDIQFAGAGAPISGTQYGDGRGNSGITFPAPKTVYYTGTGGSWGVANAWNNASTGTGASAYFPLAQDTAVITNTQPASGGSLSIGVPYQIGTIDFSARTNAVTLSNGFSVPVLGDFIASSAVSHSGSGGWYFQGRAAQMLTSAGKAFSQKIIVQTPGGSLGLNDALTTSNSNADAITLLAGSFLTNGYNVTTSGTASGITLSGTEARTFDLGISTVTIAGTGGWIATTATNLTVTGTGTISLTSTSTKTFAGGGIKTYPTLNMGSTGQISVTGSNKFANITNTANGTIKFTAGTTNEFSAFNLNGNATTKVTIGSLSTAQATLKKPTAWNVGVNSTNGGNNTGLSFTAGDNDYLSISYINGVVSAAATINGTMDTAEAADTSSATGEVLIQGTMDTAEAADTSSATGEVLIQGTLDAAESGSDTATASGKVITKGVLAATEALDTTTGVGKVLVKGALAATEASDTASVSGKVYIKGTAAVTESKDTFSGAGTLAVALNGTMAATESKDTATVSGKVYVKGALAATEASDTASVSGKVYVKGTAAVTEAKDTAAASGKVITKGALAATEAKDTATASGKVITVGVLFVTEAKDTATAAGKVKIKGTAAAYESADISTTFGKVPRRGTVAATEAADTLAIVVSIMWPPHINEITMSSHSSYSVDSAAQLQVSAVSAAPSMSATYTQIYVTADASDAVVGV